MGVSFIFKSKNEKNRRSSLSQRKRCFLNIIVITLSIIIVFFATSQNSEATYFYGQCIKGYVLSEAAESETFALSPSGTDCYNGCLAQCSQFSVGSPSTASSQCSQSEDYNKDTITACMPLCQKGETFSAFVTSITSISPSKEGISLSETGISFPELLYSSTILTTSVVNSCNTQSAFTQSNKSVYIAQHAFENGEDVIVSLASPQLIGAIENTIYTRGKRSIKLKPLAPDMSPMMPELDEIKYFNAATSLQALTDATNAKETAEAQINSYVGDKSKTSQLTTAVSNYNKAALQEAISSQQPWLVQSIVDPWFNNYANPTNSTTNTTTLTNPPLAKSSNACFSQISDIEWGNSSIQNLYNTQYIQDSGLFQNNNSNGCAVDCFSDWSKLFIPSSSCQSIDTGLPVKKGDELTISFGGNLFIKTQTQTKYTYNKKIISNNNVQDTIATVTTQSPSYLDFRTSMLAYLYATGGDENNYYLSHYLQTLQQTFGRWVVDQVGATAINIEGLGNLRGENGRANNASICHGRPTGTAGGTWNGLQGQAISFGIAMATPQNSSGQSAEQQLQNTSNTSTGQLKCSSQSLTDPGVARYVYTGILNKDIEGTLRLSYPQDIQKLAADNNYQIVGGYEIAIDWGGSPISNGLGIEYAIITAVENDDLSIISDQQTLQNLYNSPDDWAWKKLFTQKGGDSIDIKFPLTGNYRLAFRFNPKQAGISSVAPTYQQIGSYALTIDLGNHPHPPQCNTSSFDIKCPFVYIIKTVKNTFFGAPTPDGGISSSSPVAKLFSNFVAETRYTDIIRLLLVLTVIFFAITFMLGLSEVTQRQFIILALKIGVILTLISPQSWTLWGTKLVEFFVNGTLELIALTASGGNIPFMPSTEEIRADPWQIFVMFDWPISFLFSGVIFKKMCTLGITSLLGFLLFLMVLASSIVYILISIKAALLLLFCIITIALLIVLAPIAIPAMLFKTTSDIYTQWWKNLFAYALQPIFLFAGLGLFNALAITMIFAAFSFTICPVCLWELNLIFGSICLFHGWQELSILHTPTGSVTAFYLPMGILTNILIYLTIVHAMYFYCTFVTRLVNKMVTFRPGRHTDDAAAGAADSMFKAGTSAAMQGGNFAQRNIGKGVSFLKNRKRSGAEVPSAVDKQKKVPQNKPPLNRK